jgi:hypothetical protein
MAEHGRWLIVAAFAAAWSGCGHTPVAPLPEDGGMDASSDGVTAEAAGGDSGLGSDGDAGAQDAGDGG